MGVRVRLDRGVEKRERRGGVWVILGASGAGGLVVVWLVFGLPVPKFWNQEEFAVEACCVVLCYRRCPADAAHQSAGKLRRTGPGQCRRYPQCAWRWP